MLFLLMTIRLISLDLAKTDVSLDHPGIVRASGRPLVSIKATLWQFKTDLPKTRPARFWREHKTEEKGPIRASSQILTTGYERALSSSRDASTCVIVK